MLAAVLAAFLASVAIGQPAGDDPADPLALYDANDNGVIDADEVIRAVSDHLAGRIDRDLAQRVWEFYRSAAIGQSEEGDRQEENNQERSCSDPSTPSGLTASAAGRTISVSWRAVSPPPTGFYLFYSVSAESDTGAGGGTNNTTSTSASFSGLTAGASYDISVQAIVSPDSDPEMTCSSGSATTTVTVPNPPAPPDPSVSISELATTIDKGGSDSFTVSASDLLTYNSYTIEVTASDSDIGFNSGCSDLSDSEDTSAKSTAYTATFTLYGCRVGSGTVTAKLKQGSSTLDTASRTITVVMPPVTVVPEVTIAAGASPVTEGTSASFTVRASPAPTSDLIVNVSVTQNGSYIDGIPDSSVTIPGGSGSAVLTVPTSNDSVAELPGSVTAAIQARAGVYTVGGSSQATVRIKDNDITAGNACTVYDTDGDGMISRDEVLNAINDYFDDLISRSVVGAVIACYNVPTFDEGTNATRSVRENSASGTNVGNAVSATDGDNDTLTYSLSGADTGSFDIVSSSGQIQTSAALDHETKSTYSVRVRVTDGEDANGDPEQTPTIDDTISVTVNVTDVNEPPQKVGTISPRPLTFPGDPKRVRLSGKFTDPDGDTLRYTASTRDTGVVTLSVSGSTLTISPAAAGNARVKVTASDPGTLSVSQTFAVTVNPAPPPDTSPSFGSATVNDETYDTATLVSLPLPEATGGDGTLTYSVSGLPPGLRFESNMRTISGTPTTAGTYTVTYTVEDDDFDTAELTFDITVTLGKVTVLSAMPGSAHGEIALNWDPVDEADGYQVGRWIEQPGDLGVGVRFDWVVLQGSEVTIDQSNTSADVHGLTTGESYEHGVRAFQVVVSKTFEGPWSDRKMATPLDETPAAPLRLQAKNMIGDRGVLLSWRAATGAHEYVVEISGAGEIRTKTTADVKYPFDGLVPEEIYSFRVRSNRTHPSGDLLSVWSGVVGHRAPTPKHWWGHQADHIVRPVIGTLLGSRVIGDAIGRAITDWNDKLRTLNNDLEFCVTCTDDATVTVKAVNNKNDSTDDPTNDPNEGCGPARGCVKPRTESASSGPGKHMKNMYVVIEEPPRSAIEVTMPSGTPTWQHWIWEWTADQNLAGRHVQGTMNPKVYYAYIDRVMLHEFGHTLGLDDFYLDNTMDHLDALMNESSTIEDEDLKQLRAIYSRHSPH